MFSLCGIYKIFITGECETQEISAVVISGIWIVFIISVGIFSNIYLHFQYRYESANAREFIQNKVLRKSQTDKPLFSVQIAEIKDKEEKTIIMNEEIKAEEEIKQTPTKETPSFL